MTTLAEVYGSGFLYDARASGRAWTWLAPDRTSLDAWTGCPLAIAGEMPLIVNRGAATEAGLALLKDQGLDVPTRLEVFDGEASHLRLLRDLVAGGARFVVQHLLPQDELDPDAYWIPRDLLFRLNSKLHLGDLVPEPNAPRREVVRTQALAGLAARLPFVAKAVTEQPTGSGTDVAVCRTREDLARAAARFRGLQDVMVEELLEMERNLCLHFAGAAYLGSTEQVCDEGGAYRGNWIGGDPAPPAAVALAQAIVDRAASFGYRGFAGIDVAVLAAGRAVAFDLNFRLCGSTAPLLLLERKAGPDVVGRSRWWFGSGSFEDLVGAARAAAARGIFLPLAPFDAETGGHGGARPRVFGVLFGESREAVRERERELAGLGLA